MKFLHQFSFDEKIFPALVIIFALISMFIGNAQNQGPHNFPVVIGLVGACALVLVLTVTSGFKTLHKCLEHVELKTGTGSGMVNSLSPLPERSLRFELELALIHALGRDLVERMTGGADIRIYIRNAADSILGLAGSPANQACTCGPNSGCSNCPNPNNHDRLEAAKRGLESIAEHVADRWKNAVHIAQSARPGSLQAFGAAVDSYSAGRAVGAAAGRVTVGDTEVHQIPAGAQGDQRAEAEIVAAGLTAPRVTAEQIQGLMAKITWLYEQPAGTTTTLAHAFLGRFYLATGHSACVSPENFNAALGMKYAREQAEGKARDKLWEYEGYALAKALQVLP